MLKKIFFWVLIISILFDVAFSQTNNTTDNDKTKKLGSGVIIMMILGGFSLFMIIIGFCLDKPLVFIMIGLFTTLGVFLILKIWPKNEKNLEELVTDTVFSDQKKSLYELYNNKKNYNVDFFISNYFERNKVCSQIY